MSLPCHSTGHKFIPVEILENDIYSGIYKVLDVLRPHWSLGNINFKIFTDGITNKLVACRANNEDIVLVRIYGNKTDLLIDRNAEVRNINLLHKYGLAPEIYGVFKNGLAYQYYPGVTLTPDTVIEPKISSLVAKTMAKMHKVQMDPELMKQTFELELKRSLSNDPNNRLKRTLYHIYHLGSSKTCELKRPKNEKTPGSENSNCFD